MSQTLKEYSVRKLGSSHGAPRLWLEGNQPQAAGFTPGLKYDVAVDAENKRVRLVVAETGRRVVSAKERNGRKIPVIDINSQEVLAIFKGMNCVRVIVRTNEIHLLPEIVEVKKAERVERFEAKQRAGLPLSIGSFSHGGGILSHALHAGLTQAGVASRLAFANDIREDLLDHAQAVNDAWSPDTIKLAAPMQHLTIDTWMMRKLPPVDIIEAGIPCSGASVAGRSKNKTAMAEAHEEVGHLVVPFIQLIGALNPLVVVLENVKPYQSTASMWLLRHSLRDMGYHVHETVLDAGEFNELEHRERMCMVAVTQGIAFDFASLVKPAPRARKLGEVLEDIPEDAACWSSFDYLKRHQERHAAKGNGFTMQVFDRDSDHVNTMTKGYAKIRPTDPKVAHPTQPGLMRQLTVAEHARVKGIPDHLAQGLTNTLGHEMLGQSVCYAPFVAVGALLGRALKKGVSRQVDSYAVDLLAAA